MKRVFIILLAVLCVLFGSIYLLIPGNIIISKARVVSANRDALFRKLQTADSWEQWWPGTITTEPGKTSYTSDGIEFMPAAPRTLSVPMNIHSSSIKSVAELTFVANNIDSTTIHLETSVVTAINPVKRIRQYFIAKKIGKVFSDILRSLDTTFSKTQNLYGYDIRKGRVADSILISTFEEIKGYPSWDKVYELIDKLKDYIKKNSAEETNFPMLNISTVDSLHFIVKVAIPVNKRLPDSGDINYKKMLGGGNILITEVKGGPFEIRKAYQQIVNYVVDHSRIAPAISFESLVTDRRKQADTSQWITRIYYPVM